MNLPIRPLAAAALLVASAAPTAFAQDPAPRTRADSVRVAALREAAIEDSLSLLTDRSYPEYECQTEAVRARRRYDRVNKHGQPINANGLIRDQQELADALACAQEPDIVFRSGVDFTNADGFAVKNADLRVGAAYNVNIGARRFPLLPHVFRVSRFATTLRVDRHSALVRRSHFQCTGTGSPSAPGAAPEPLRLSERCATDTFNADSTVRTRFVPTPTPFREDDHAARGLWSGSALFRWETPYFTNKALLFGPAIEGTASTDPARGTAEGMLVRWMGGLSFRQFSTQDRERLSALVMYGTLYHFTEKVVRYDSAFISAHPEVGRFAGAKAVAGGVENVFGDRARPSTGLSLRLLFQPFPSKDGGGYSNLYVRALGEFPDRGHRAVSLAILAQGDLDKILSGITGTGPAKPPASITNTAAPAAPDAPKAPATTTTTTTTTAPATPATTTPATSTTTTTATTPRGTL